MSNFIDETIVDLISGTGGSGAVGFHREKHVPRGGPNGADGGRGGDLVLMAERGCRTLYDFKFRERFEAQSGVHAIGNRRGRDGEGIILKVPLGTVVTDAASGEHIADLTIHGMKVVVCKGGRGGHGNMHYVSSIRQVPNFAEKGEPAQRRKIKLELKLLADIGLVGLPNAGKSTLLSQISAAKPKIGAYPFTTISPNMGIVSVADTSFAVADLPGLIEGASEGIGLGHQFLRHAERTKVLVHIIDAFPIDESDPLANYHLIRKELIGYSETLGELEEIIALNKIDLDDPEKLEVIMEQFRDIGNQVFAISGVTGQGIQELKYAMMETYEETETENVAPVNLILAPKPQEDPINVIKIEDGYVIVGTKVTRMVAMTNLGNSDAVRYLHRRLQRMGIHELLREAGAVDGDTVYVKDAVFAFEDKL